MPSWSCTGIRSPGKSGFETLNHAKLFRGVASKRIVTEYCRLYRRAQYIQPVCKSTVDAAGVETPTADPTVATKTVNVYDTQGNVVEVQHPRTFAEAGDFKTTMAYTGRNLLASRTEATGTVDAATESFTYNLDRTVSERTDFRGHVWS